MQDSDPFSPGRIGAALAVTGLALLMLAEPASPGRVATAACCLVAALAAFAIAGVRRSGRRPPGGAVPPRAAASPRAAAPARGSAVPIRVPADITLPGDWSMPLSQRDPRVHAALSMPTQRFQGSEPRAGAGGSEAAMAEVRARHIAGQD